VLVLLEDNWDKEKSLKKEVLKGVVLREVSAAQEFSAQYEIS
jgi:hypothetical protein